MSFKDEGKYKVSIEISKNKGADDLLMHFAPAWIFVELMCDVLEKEAEVTLFGVVLIALGLGEVALLVLIGVSSLLADHLCWIY